jgi:hypothetical protein
MSGNLTLSWIMTLIVISFLFVFQAESDQVNGEWKFAAMVLDQVCLVVLTLLTIALSAAIFFTAPHVMVW